jgi:glycosyltransferase involved in cell wall biosynthesis/predicted SAM-dependent methyltransferase
MIKLLLYGEKPIPSNKLNFGSAIVEYFAPWEEEEIHKSLCEFRPDVIIGYGTTKKLPECLQTANYQILKRWVHSKKDMLTEEEIIYTIKEVYHSADIGKHDSQDSNPYISVCTGTYNAEKFIEETYQYIYNQTYSNWEWVVVDDGSTDNTVNILRDIAANDHRVKVIANTHIGKIGMIKRISHGIANGEFLVELDHDDILVETCLEEIIQAFQKNPDAGMVYSNCAEWMQQKYKNGKLIPWERSKNDIWHTYDSDYWHYRDTEWNGKICKEGLQWDVMGLVVIEDNIVNPVILHMPICPNHVRAYRADVYRYVGGYRDLVYADDYDLMLRMFIYSRIVHIPKMLYIQRMVQNTWPHQLDFLTPMFEFMRIYYAPQLKYKLMQLNLMREDGKIIIPDKILMPNGKYFNKENANPIQLGKTKNKKKIVLSTENMYAKVVPEPARQILLNLGQGGTPMRIKTQEVFDAEITKAINAEKESNLKLELGCGEYVAEGFIGVDMKKADHVGIVHDLNVFPWPFKDNTVSHIRAYHIFEHLKDIISVMNECYRILKPEGILELEVPTTDGHGAFSDPTHVSFWNQDTLNYFCQELNPVVYAFSKDYGVFADFILENISHYEMRKNVVIMNAILTAKKQEPEIERSIQQR